MVVYRITLKEYVEDLTGTGAMLFGGRWNSKGKRMLYTSQSLSLAALEIAVNASRIVLKKTFYFLALEIPKCKHEVNHDQLKDHWNGYPHSYHTVQLGDAFLDTGRLCLKVPSAVIETEFNYLLNPLSEQFSGVRIVDSRPFLFDSRIKD